jgi:hypothetical protein
MLYTTMIHKKFTNSPSQVAPQLRPIILAVNRQLPHPRCNLFQLIIDARNAILHLKLLSGCYKPSYGPSFWQTIVRYPVPCCNLFQLIDARTSTFKSIRQLYNFNYLFTGKFCSYKILISLFCFHFNL